MNNMSHTILHAQNLSKTDLIMAMEANYYAHASYIGRNSKNIEIIDNEYLLTISTGFVGRTRLGNNEEALQKVIDLLKKYYNFLDFSWYITPCTQPGCLMTLLDNSGFYCAGSEPGMVFTIKDTKIPHPTYPGLSLSLVDSLESLIQFDRLYAEIWNKNMKSYFINAQHIILQKNCPLKLYVGYERGRPVGIYQLFFSGGIVGIYAVGTIPKVRQQGLATSFLSILLADILQAGHEIVALQSTPIAINMYHRLGFVTLCEFHEYKPYLS